MDTKPILPRPILDSLLTDNNTKIVNNKSTTISKDNDYDSESRTDGFISNAKSIGTDYSYKHNWIWKNIFLFSALHVFGLWGFGILLTGGISFRGFFWNFFLMVVSGLGIVIGAHRYYTHKTFKATPLLRAALILAQTFAGQNSMYVWARDHRLHHRYSDTDADPHNSNRGFFFSHIGWLMCKKHPYVIEYGKDNDMSDLEADWMVMFQKKYYIFLYVSFSIVIPVLVPVLYFGDTWVNSLLYFYGTRYLYTLHCTWLINSAAHMYGTRPYDKNINPVECWFASFATLGEGWHNYHHTYPWDYKAAELPMSFNFSATVIRFFEKIGLAYDLRTVPQDMVRKRIKRTGDGTHYELGNDETRSTLNAVEPLIPLNPTKHVKQCPYATEKPTIEVPTRRPVNVVTGTG